MHSQEFAILIMPINIALKSAISPGGESWGVGD